MKLGLSTLLFCIFLTLKLCKVIDWSWWWVTAPLWGIFAIAFIVVFCQAYAEQKKRKALSAKSGWMRRLKEVQKEQEELIRKQKQS
ncbi:MAG: hypothetical protein HDR77_02530 [Bacteroides sp.]|nr:hypothetical protein [Bacteroides sp.]